VDHDLLLDLRHLDDPEPPRFGALRAEEAAHRAAQARARRARVVAGSVLAVALVAGLGGAAIGTTRDEQPTLSAQAPSSTSMSLGPATTDTPSPTEPPSPVDPAAAAPGAATVTTALPSPVTTTPAPAATTPGSAPTVTRPPAGAVATTLLPARGTSQPPSGSVAAPAGLRLTLTLDRRQLAAGSSVHGVVRFENRRSTAVTLSGGGCSSMWRADLYKDGEHAPSPPITCMMLITQVVQPGQVVVADVDVAADPSLAAGTYGAFTTIRLGENGLLLHSEAVDVAVTRP
jgi:hypothetical protein